MLDDLSLYDALYMLASGEGREKALFGSCGPLAREAFSRSLLPGANEFPALWYEIPLAGEPRFDLHVAYSNRALARRGAQGPTGGYLDDLASWYAQAEHIGGGLALAFDVSTGQIDHPALHMNISGAPASEAAGFFAAAGRTDAEGIYRDFAGRLPQGWRVWYTGLHPGRPGTPVRVDCFVDDGVSKGYHTDAELFAADLRRVGCAPSEAALDAMRLIVRAHLGLELQFDVLGDGSVGPTIGVSGSMHLGPAHISRARFMEEDGAAGLMRELQRRDRIDGRWELLPDAMFTVLADGYALYNVPTFVKLRVRDGSPFDVKAYLQAGAQYTATEQVA